MKNFISLAVVLFSYLYLSSKGFEGINLALGVVVFGIIGGEVIAFIFIVIYGIFAKK